MDIIESGSTDVSLLFALSTGGLTISAINVSCVRYSEGSGSSFAVIGPTALTELATITTAHTDNYAKYLSTDATSGASFIMRVDVPDTYFASGKDKCVVSIYDDAGAEIQHRIFRLSPNPVNVKQISDDATAADNLELACDNYSVTRGLSGTALPAAAADAAGGLPISDAGGLDLDTYISRLTANVATETKQDIIDTNVDSLITNLAVVDGIVDSILVDTDTTIPGLIAALNDLSAAQVNTEVLDVINVDTYGEPGQGAPGATISLAAKINYLYKAWRNLKKQTTSEFELYNDAGTIVDQKCTDSDDGTTTTLGKIISGP